MPKEHMFYEPEEKAALMDKALGMISDGDTLTSAAMAIGVSKSTLHDWMALPEYVERSARAREALTHSLADQCLYIADSAKPDDAQVVRIQIDTRLRLIGKWNRKDYGEKVDGEQTVKHEISEELKAWLDQRP